MQYAFIHPPLRCIVIQEYSSSHFYVSPDSTLRHLKRSLVPSDFAAGKRAVTNLLAYGLEGADPQPFFAESHLDEERPPLIEFWDRAKHRVEGAGGVILVRDRYYTERKAELRAVEQACGLPVVPSPHVGRLIKGRADAWEKVVLAVRNAVAARRGEWPILRAMLAKIGSDEGASAIQPFIGSFSGGMAYPNLCDQLLAEQPERSGAGGRARLPTARSLSNWRSTGPE